MLFCFGLQSMSSGELDFFPLNIAFIYSHFKKKKRYGE